MTRARRTDLGLLALAVILLVVWFVFPSSNEDAPSADWSDLAREPPRTIRIRRDASRLVLEYRRDDSSSERYVTQAEHAAHTDPAALDRLLNALSRLEIVRPVDEHNDEHGLEHPTLEIELETSSGRRAVKLGGPAPSPKAARYAMIVDRDRHQRVVLAPTSVESLDLDPNDLLDQRVFDLVPSEMQELKWSTPEGPQHITRTDAGHWLLAAHGNERARRPSVERFLSRLAELKLTKHLSTNVAAAALRPGPVAELSVTSLREERRHAITLRVGGVCPGSGTGLGLVLEGERRVAGCIDEKAFRGLLPDRSALLDDGLVSLHADEVERLSLTTATHQFALTREGSEFRLEATNQGRVPLALGNGLLESVASIRGTSAGACEFEAQGAQPLLKLESYLLGNVKTLEQVRLGPVSDDGTRTVCRDDRSALRLTATSARLLELSEVLLRDQTLLDLPLDAVSEIRIQAEGSERLAFREDPQRRFVLVEPAHTVFETTTIERLREQIASLHAMRWLVATEPKHFGGELRNMTLDLTLRGDVTHPGPPVASANAPNPAASANAPNPAASANAVNAGEASTPRQPVRRRLRVGLVDKRTALGWIDREPMPFLLDPELSEVLNEIAIRLVR